MSTHYTHAQHRVVMALQDNPTLSNREIGALIGLDRANIDQHIRNICKVHGIESGNKRMQLIDALRFDRDTQSLERMEIEYLFELIDNCMNEILTRPDFDHQKLEYTYKVVKDGIGIMNSSSVLTNVDNSIRTEIEHYIRE